MKITCLCMYHGRNVCLPEAVESYLRQYPCGCETELLILNDCEQQQIVCDAPGVRVLNVPEYPTMPAKQNEGVTLALGEWVALWDDDDISLPWRLQVLEENRKANPDAMAFCHKRAWYVENSDIVNIAHNTFAGSAYFNAAYYLRSGGCPPDAKGADRGAWEAMKPLGRCVEIVHGIAEIPYLYRWKMQVPHDSALYQRWSRGEFVHGDFHAQVVTAPWFKRGRVEIVPHWKRDYVADVVAAINKGVPVV